jgi:protein involved in sex pheromone biosynthesis
MSEYTFNGRTYYGADSNLELQADCPIRFIGKPEMHALMFTQSQIDRAVAVDVRNAMDELPDGCVIIDEEIDAAKLDELLAARKARK